ncbi:hypothetical protein [Okeania sp. SIO2C9]|nr:hypothetical protein [Okeania sp. SIO2C9]
MSSPTGAMKRSPQESWLKTSTAPAMREPGLLGKANRVTAMGSVA